MGFQYQNLYEIIIKSFMVAINVHTVLDTIIPYHLKRKKKKKKLWKE